MRFVKQFVIIIFISCVGELLHYLLPLPIPASIYGLVLMFTVLKTGLLPLAKVKDASVFLIEIMPVMFIPSGVAILQTIPVIKQYWIQFFAIAVVSTGIVMVVSGLVTQAIIRKGGKK
ncbi:MAG: CidA/LrgA family protein [Treponema sp.]|nr:CidA/LrgA family protein [Treponema sp.]